MTVKLTPQRLFLIIILIIASAVFWLGTADAAPQDMTPCKLQYDHALALVQADHSIREVQMVGQWAIEPTTAREDFYALPRVVTVTLFAGDDFAGLIDVRGRGDVLRVRVRPGGKNLQTCFSGAIDAAVVRTWIGMETVADLRVTIR